MRISASCRRSGDLIVGGEIRESRLTRDARGNVGDIGVERELRGWDGWVHAGEKKAARREARRCTKRF